ncbi:UNVERIFIED_CONTAM: efflux RND transporter periplasmic adaptor subunit [Methylobacteriaceae bacterium AG10]|nr:efflux RND transporter periplasmic adaptor subunit [Methylobacteriaceae bacterium AG10]
MRRRVVLPVGLALGVGALGALVLTDAGAGLRVNAGPVLSDLQARLSSAMTPAAHRPPAANGLSARVAVEGGRAVVRLSDEEQSRIGVETARLKRMAHRIEVQAFGSVLDLARVTELTNSYASAKAQLQTAEAKTEVSRAAYVRARSLGQYATKVQLETAEGTFRTDEAALAAAQSQLRTLAATAQQEWGTVIGRAIVERSPAITRLIERTDFLVQVTLPPGETLKAPPAIAHAEVPPQSERVTLRYVSPATRTDQRIQGVSYFYTVAGDSGLLPGMSTLAFLTSERETTGIAVPESAVVHWQGSAWIYRSVGDDAFARHPLKADAPISDDAYVVDDLGAEAEIVVTGPQAVLSEELKGQIQAADADDD